MLGRILVTLVALLCVSACGGEPARPYERDTVLISYSEPICHRHARFEFVGGVYNGARYERGVYCIRFATYAPAVPYYGTVSTGLWVEIGFNYGGVYYAPGFYHSPPPQVVTYYNTTVITQNTTVVNQTVVNPPHRNLPEHHGRLDPPLSPNPHRDYRVEHHPQPPPPPRRNCPPYDPRCR